MPAKRPRVSTTPVFFETTIPRSDVTDLTIVVDSRELSATWSGRNPTTREAITEALPLEGHATRWGDELYFSIDVDVPAEEPQTEVPTGGIAYWPQGNALCLFWGPTPASRDDEPRGAAPVNVIGRMTDVEPLANVEGGAHVRVERG